MRRTEGIPAEWVKILHEQEREGRFWDTLINMGFQVERGKYFLEHKTDTWHLVHRSIQFKLAFYTKEQLVVTIIENGSINNYDKGITYDVFLTQLRGFVRKTAQDVINSLDKVTI